MGFQGSDKKSAGYLEESSSALMIFYLNWLKKLIICGYKKWKINKAVYLFTLTLKHYPYSFQYYF